MFSLRGDNLVKLDGLRLSYRSNHGKGKLLISDTSAYFEIFSTGVCHLAPTAPPLTCGVSSECLGTRSYETTSRDQRGKIEMFFSSIGACTAAKFPIANHHSQINTHLYSASLIRHIWQQRHSDSEFDAL